MQLERSGSRALEALSARGVRGVVVGACGCKGNVLSPAAPADSPLVCHFQTSPCSGQWRLFSSAQ